MNKDRKVAVKPEMLKLTTNAKKSASKASNEAPSTSKASNETPSTSKASNKAQSTSKASNVAPSTSKASNEAPSTSKASNKARMEVVGSQEFNEANLILSSILDNCFKEKDQVTVNRSILEALVSQSLDFLNDQEYGKEKKNWSDKYRLLQSQQIRMNKVCYALKKQVENAKFIIKKLIDDRAILNKRPRQQNIHPSLLKKTYRTVGLQVCTVGPLTVNNNASIASCSGVSRAQNVIQPGKMVYGIKQSDLRSTLLESSKTTSSNSGTGNVKRPSIGKEKLPQENRGKMPVNKPNMTNTINQSILINKRNIISSKRESAPVNITSTKQEDQKPNTTYIKKQSPLIKNDNTDSRKKESVFVNKANTTCTKKEIMSVNKNMILTKNDSIYVEKRKSVVTKSDNVSLSRKNLNLTKEYACAVGSGLNLKKEAVNVKVMKEAIPAENNSPESFKEFTGSKEIVHIKEEIINENYDVNDRVSNNKREVVQDKVDIHSNKRCYSELNNEKQEPSNKTGSFNIRIRSPEYINEQYAKKAKISVAEETKPDNDPAEAVPGPSASFTTLPQYPISPKCSCYSARPPAPVLQIGQKQKNCKSQGIMLTWNFECNPKPENIEEYQLYAFQETSKIDYWKKVGNIKAIPLPIACFLTQFIKGEKYYFILRAVDNENRLGDFSFPVSIVPE